MYFLDNMTDTGKDQDDKEIPSNLHILSHVYRFVIVTVVTNIYHECHVKEWELHACQTASEDFVQGRQGSCSA